MLHRARIAWLCLALGGLLLGCASSSEDDAETGGNALSETSSAGANSEPIWPPDVTRLDAESVGFFRGGALPAGSGCAPGSDVYTLDIQNGLLEGMLCKAEADGPFEKRPANRLLTAQQIEQVKQAMQKLSVVAHPPSCPADASERVVTLTSRSRGSEDFSDPRACMRHGKIVDSLDAVFDLLAKLIAQ